ncbi:hypothetical protein [Streptomyces sp. MZ04]|uniref:hypothetical protein n=1 Tax=Streptomyces sp. MZ04 TaxID=2559236 RepID=UPI00107E68B1|nr:hypothetical protein [Streptomyces sp. MZ04]TGB09875.1 hypothetical protein E2651_15445 [Streptomyces sp. MZ04]
MLAALTLLIALPYGAASHAVGEAKRTHARVAAAEPRPFGAECRTGVEGSQAVAYCHNPYPETDRIRLHVECDRWWDIDSDGVLVEAGPAMTVRLTGRCWKEIRSVWVSHQR